MARKLENKVVLITGASSGFGKDAARLFAKEGCDVILTARRLDRLQTLADCIQDEGGTALAVPCDVSSRADIEVMVQTVLDVYGKIDILFNNAGFGRLDWLDRLEPERDIETQISVNLIGLIQVTRAVLPHMLKRGSGHIINMSSVAGWIAPPTHSVYAASKHGVRGFTDALRREVQSLGLHVSGIYPGPAITEFGQHTGDSPYKKIRGRHLLYMKSDYVARRVVGLAKRPRRRLIIPWWFRLVLGFEYLFPGVVDWFLDRTFVRPNRSDHY
ncbi:MAG: SDR family NAD(P)-dependent oxidoreductase [Anaerolineales bacterium]|nr:SDR family NAD(P)-dependent oxidoreductase [Anaerolineales bacterium]